MSGKSQKEHRLTAKWVKEMDPRRTLLRSGLKRRMKNQKVVGFINIREEESFSSGY